MDQINKEDELVRDLQDKCNLSSQQQEGNDHLHKMAGQVSAGSQESVFSSTSLEDVSDFVNSDSSSSNSSLSGKSNRDSGTDNHSLEVVNQQIKILNIHRTTIPAIQEVADHVKEVKVRFLKDLQDIDNAHDLYDSQDIEELRKPLPALQEQEQSLAFRLISRFFNWPLVLSTTSDSSSPYANKFTEKQYNDIVESLKGLLTFRKNYQLSSARADEFCKEFYILNGMFQFGYDRQHVPVVYLRASVHRKWSHNLDDSFRRYVAWQLDQITKSTQGAAVSKTVGRSGAAKDGSFGICFDCINVSYACLDLDFLRFIIRCLVHYYPTYCRYALCVDLPWLFRSVWKMVRGWLPEDEQNNVQLITAKELPEYIEEDQIPTCLRATGHLKASEKSPKLKNPKPVNWDSLRGIEEFAEELNVSSSEVKQFKTHVEKVRKDYEKIGAI